MKLYCPECKETFNDVMLMSCPHDDARLFVLEEEEADSLLGVILDHRFRIESKLGQGGMGAVYTATQLSVGRKVAVKVLKKELVDREVALERFYRESKLTSELSHPNIVKLIDFGQDRERDLLYLVMELVSGVNMGDLLEQGRMRIALALEIIYQACGALTEPHSLGIIHRDLKPDNMLIVPISDGTMQVKVLDFGIARVLEANTQLTATGMVCGTPAYMAPEQAQNQEIGPETDLYALGVMLYEMLCGVPPFQGQNSLQIMLQHIQIAPKPMSHYLPPSALPDEVEALVHDLLSKDPRGRPRHARDVRTTIEKIKRLYNLEPVRIDPSAPLGDLFSDFILYAMPAPSNDLKTHTRALRRETNLERQPAASSYTTDERQQIAFAETSLEAQPDLVTVPAHTALGLALLDDTQRHAHRPEPAPHPARPMASHAPMPEHVHSAQIDPRAASTPQTVSTPLAPPAGGLGIKAVAAGIVLLVVLAAFTLIALVASNMSSSGTLDPVATPPSTPSVMADEAPTPPPRIVTELPPTLTAPPSPTAPVVLAPAEDPPAPVIDDPPPQTPTEAKRPTAVVKKTSEVPQKKDERPAPQPKPTKVSETPTPRPERIEETPLQEPVEPVKASAPVEKPEKKGFGNLFGDQKKKKPSKKDPGDHFITP